MSPKLPLTTSWPIYTLHGVAHSSHGYLYSYAHILLSLLTNTFICSFFRISHFNLYIYIESFSLSLHLYLRSYLHLYLCLHWHCSKTFIETYQKWKNENVLKTRNYECRPSTVAISNSCCEWEIGVQWKWTKAKDGHFHPFPSQTRDQVWPPHLLLASAHVQIHTCAAPIPHRNHKDVIHAPHPHASLHLRG